MKIGPYQLDSNILLAPMAGVTDAPFRRLCRSFGAGLAASEMTTADVGLWHTDKSRLRLDLSDEMEPRVIQLAGSDPAQMADAAARCVDIGAQIIDINMGCPAKKVCNKLAGSALLQDEQLVARILRAVVGSVAVPVTLKIRTGWSKAHKNADRIAHIAEAEGIQALAVHGRTRECRYQGEAEYETIARICAAATIPIIANGDIRTPEKALEVLRLSNADALMIGRGAQGQPWIFQEIIHFLQHGTILSTLEKNILRDIMLDHLFNLYRFYGDKTGVRVARKHLSWYCAGLPHSDEYRGRVVRVATAAEQVQLTREYFCGIASGEACLAA